MKEDKEVQRVPYFEAEWLKDFNYNQELQEEGIRENSSILFKDKNGG